MLIPTRGQNTPIYHQTHPNRHRLRNHPQDANNNHQIIQLPTQAPREKSTYHLIHNNRFLLLSHPPL